MLLATGVLEHRCSTSVCPTCKATLGCGHTACHVCKTTLTLDRTFIACPVCEQRNPDCDFCKGNMGGLVPVDGCPYSAAPIEAFDLIDAADLVEKTGWPSGAGWSREPAAVVDGVQRVWAEFEKVKAALRSR